ncbi:hypothetical protein GMJLKIPL_4590 [Methylobacterium isbiliense]|jgi:hypothetical protein|uniref:Uncharacterized protein n=1 Tax=Methylobacterium isbiliense TaxID=315478 RepID=A0ABQ4SJY7_9HYPH|nr:hypothetical protein GMJLKIPL_4590 [Methylobacterium isbiliense]
MTETRACDPAADLDSDEAVAGITETDILCSSRTDGPSRRGSGPSVRF